MIPSTFDYTAPGSVQEARGGAGKQDPGGSGGTFDEHGMGSGGSGPARPGQGGAA